MRHDKDCIKISPPETTFLHITLNLSKKTEKASEVFFSHDTDSFDKSLIYLHETLQSCYSNIIQFLSNSKQIKEGLWVYYKMI